MSNESTSKGIELMKATQFSEAIPFFVQAIEEDPLHYGNWYMAGQCFRFTNDFPNAVRYLKKAAELDPDEKAVLLGLGIALQLTEQFEEAIETFRRALEIDPNYVQVFNSLALTQMKQGHFEVALHNYDAGLKALTRQIVRTFNNSRSRGIIKQNDSYHLLWLEFAFFGAVFLASLEENINKLAWPTGDQAIQEERDEYYDGLYWIDKAEEQGETTRLFLPNYFNTFREHLTFDRTYYSLLRGKGSSLSELGRQEEAEKHIDEAESFLPTK